MKKNIKNNSLAIENNTRNKKEQIPILYHGICFFLVILGMFFCLEKIFLSGVSSFVLVLMAGIISVSVEIMKLGRGQKIIISLFFYLILAGVIIINYPLILSGENEIGNRILTMINQYYHTDYALWFVKQEKQGKVLVFLIICALSGFLEGLFSLFTKKRGQKQRVFLIIPILLISAVLMLGKEPSILGVILILMGFLLSQLEFGEKGILPLGVIMCLTVAAAAIFAKSNIIQHMLEIYHEPVRKWQLQVEDKAMEALNKISGGSYLFGKTAQSEFLLKNDKPNQSGKEIFQITVEKLPVEPLYIRGFIGGDYENGSWKKVSEQKFSDWVEEQGFSNQEGKEQIQNFPYDFLKETENFLKNICSDSFFYKLQPQKVKMELKSPISGYTLVPYFTNLSQKQSIEADGALLPDNQKIFEWQSYLSIDETSMEILENMILEEKLKVIEFWREYENYVKEMYTQLPQQGLEKLKNYANDNINEELIHLYYDSNIDSYYSDIDIRATRQEAIEGWIHQVRNLLHLDTSYSLDIKEVPEGKDYAEYFLLEQKKGYCVHYATTGTLLFRIYGIPARYVNGYVVLPNDFKKNSDGTYTAIITDKRAHAWTEIFRENIGFCPVELTPPAYTDLLQNVGQNEVLQAIEQMDKSEEELKENPNTQQEEQKKEQEEQKKEQEKKAEENAQKEQTKNLDKKEKSFIIPSIVKRIAVFLMGCIALAVVLCCRRKWVLRNRQAKFCQPNHTKGALEMGYMIKRMRKALGLAQKQNTSEKEMPNLDWKRTFFLLQKAKFSEKGISKEEYQEISVFYQLLEQYMLQENGKLKKWLFDLR